MIDDDILREIRATRDAFAESHNFDLRAMAETLKKMDLKGREVVSFESASPEQAGSTAPKSASAA